MAFVSKCIKKGRYCAREYFDVILEVLSEPVLYQ